MFQAAAKGVSNILCITVSKKLSSMYESAMEARRLAQDSLGNVNIEIMDSRTATPSQGMIVLAAARSAAEGNDIREVVKAAESVRERVMSFFYLDTLRHVYRSGRVPKIASQIGTALNIKPILQLGSEVHFSRVVLNRKQGMERLIRTMREKVGDKPIRAAVSHAYAREEAERLKERIASEFECIELWITEFSPVMGYACGTGTVGVSFYPD